MIFFIFFSSSSTVSENISAEITSVATEENVSIFHGEINQPRGIQFPQTKGRSFQETGSTYITGYTMTKKKMLHFAMYVCKPWKVVTKGFRSWKKSLYIEKNKPGAFEKHSQSDSHKSIINLIKITCFRMKLRIYAILDLKFSQMILENLKY